MKGKVYTLLEARAKPRLTSTEGLWRSSTRTRPGSMTEYIRQQRLLPREEIEHIAESTPAEIIRFQEGFANAIRTDTVAAFLESHAAED